MYSMFRQRQSGGWSLTCYLEMAISCPNGMSGPTHSNFQMRLGIEEVYTEVTNYEQY